VLFKPDLASHGTIPSRSFVTAFHLEGDFHLECAFNIEGGCYDVKVTTQTGDDLGISSVIELGLALRRAQHLLGQRIDEDLRPLYLNLGLWRVLLEVGQEPGASASELARASFHTPQTLGGLLRRLEDRGLVVRSVGRGRIVENHLTDKGHEALDAATQRVEEIISGTLTTFGPTERATLTRLVTDYADTLSRSR
jgi:DNA-binding MarR family transcriptional regulator